MLALLRSIRGISPILATLLLIVIVVGSSITAYVWIQSSTQTQLNSAGGFIKIENTRFYDSDKIELTIRNIGISDVTLDKVYINNVGYSAVQQIESKTYETITLVYSWESGTRYEIKVATKSGLYAEGIYSSPSSSGNVILLQDGFEGSPWDMNWDDLSSNWIVDSSVVNNGSASAHASNGNEVYFTCDDLNANGANSISLEFWFRKDDTESNDFTLFYFNGSSYNLIDELDNDGADDVWLHYTTEITDSQYFVSNFQVRFDATLGNNENVWVDDVIITKIS
jgi:flagellin-like protein